MRAKVDILPRESQIRRRSGCGACALLRWARDPRRQYSIKRCNLTARELVFPTALIELTKGIDPIQDLPSPLWPCWIVLPKSSWTAAYLPTDRPRDARRRRFLRPTAFSSCSEAVRCAIRPV